MIGKFATASALMLLVLTTVLGAQAFGQTTPPEHQPAAPAPAAQEPAAQNPAPPPSTAPAPAAPAPTAPVTTTPATAQQPANGQEEEESTSLRRVKPKDYKNWTYNVGAGANLNSGTTKNYVRGGGFEGTAGVARNANKYLGLRADFFYADLPLRDSTQQLASSTGATSYVLAGSIDPIINLQVTKTFSVYALLGPAFYHRAGSLQGNTTVPGSPCNAFWTWWGVCSNVSVPLNGSFVNSSQNQFGYNVGAGVGRKMPSGAEIYLEFRLMHGSGNNTTTDFRPISLGFRW
jgi:opacity protein-like surface antigen